tara:strand:+ start:161 stop:904 length:744 start_codon:yes stop_codon:yes gene_type:complete
MNEKIINSIKSNFKTLIIALFIAVVIRSLFFQPFYIPSSSMEPTMLIGDRIFASKYSYGVSKHSFPFSPPFFSGRIFGSKPNRGDIVIFKTPQDNRTDFVKRLIGLPKDEIQFINGELLINSEIVSRKKSTRPKYEIRCNNDSIEVETFIETLPNGVEYTTAYRKEGTYLNSDKYIVPNNHYFFLGDNRDCSSDSRYTQGVGYVSYENLVGKAEIIFFSNDSKKGSVLKLWNWNETFRFNRFFKKLK